MRSFNRLIWLIMLLCVAMMAMATSVRCLTEDKTSDISEEMFDGDLLENLDYDSFDESENEAPVKQEYGGSAPPVAPPSYSPPPPSYSQPPPPPPAYSPPPPAYNSAPQQQQQQSYATVQPQYNPVPLPNYTASNDYGSSTYLAIEPQISTNNYQQQQVPQPVYETLVPAVYQPVTIPVANTVANYTQYQQQQPVYEQVTYQQVAPVQQVSSYQAVPVQQPAYQPAQQQQQQTYQPPPQQPTYQPPPQQPTYQPQQQQQQQQTYQQQPAQVTSSTNYVAPVAKPQPTVVVPPPPVYQPQQPVNYQAQKPVQQQQNYSSNYNTQVSYKPQQQQQQQAIVPTVYKQPMQQYLPALIQKYSAAELAPFLSPYGYRSNHWSLFYYRGAQNPYVQHSCPKHPYMNGPSYKDIEVAFIDALAQLGQLRQPNYAQMPPLPYPSASARHQIFSLLSQQPARMDEEGLLVEMVSRHLADRLCLTKWDKQRYLPQLTKFISTSQFPAAHSCNNYYRNPWQGQAKQCYLSKYRTFDGFCNNPYHPYWGKSNVCHIRLLSPDYADGISLPRVSINPRYPLPNPRQVSNNIHNDVPIDGPYNLMKMQWGQFINHDITNTALSAYDGLVDCCKQPQTRGCWPIYVPPGDRFYGHLNVTCLNFIRSGVCPLCQLGPRQQSNKNTAYLDASHVYGNTHEQAVKLRTFIGGQLRTSSNRLGEQLLPISDSQEQCFGTCYLAGDSRVNQHPALTALHVILLRNHNYHANKLAQRHPNWSDEILFQEARRLNIAEYQMITYNEYLPIVFGPILSAYYQLIPKRSGNTYYNQHVDPTTWNEYSTATCRFGHSQIQPFFGLYTRILGYGQSDHGQQTFRLKDWFMRPSLLTDGQLVPLMNGLLARPSSSVDPWLTNDVRNHLYQSHREHSGGDLAATNIWRGRDHGIPGYVHYLEYCFNHKVRGWKDLALFIPPFALNQLRRLYRVVENIDLWSGGIAERHFPGADIGPTFACVNGIQYYHLKFGDRYYFEHTGQAGSFAPQQLDEIRRTTLARLLCRTAYLPAAPQYAFMAPSMYNPLVNCSQIAEFNYGAF